MMTDGDRWLNFNTEGKQVREQYHSLFIKRRELLFDICQRYSISLTEATTADDPLELLQKPWTIRRK